MDNRLFAILSLLFLLPFAGWMVYDWNQSVDSIRKEGLHRDLLTDKSGSGASVAFIFHFTEPTYSHALSTGEIEGLAKSGNGGERYHVYGLTQAGFSCGTRFEVNWSKTWFKDEYKVWVEDMRVEFTYNTLNVYVTNSYDEASCEYQATLEHENQHVALHRELYEKYQGIFREKIGGSQAIPLSSHPVESASLEAGKESVGKIISAVTDPLFQQFHEEMQEAQGRIDTPDNYAALKQHCQHW